MAMHGISGLIEEIQGYILPHEHVFCDFTSLTGDLDHLLNDKAVAVRELKYFELAGGHVIVDITPVDLGRQPEFLMEISKNLNLEIVMGTGWYRKDFYPQMIDYTSTKVLANLIIQELTIGIAFDGGDSIKAGVIGEIGVDRDIISAQEERVLRASAMACLETGAPISTHASMYPVGIKQIEILQEYKIAPEKIIIGHADTYLDQDYHQKIVDSGCYIQFDTIGRNHMNADKDRISAILDLVQRGYENQILLSTDRCLRSDLKTFGGLGYDFLLTDFREMLINEGLSSQTFEIMTKENPFQALSW